MSSLKKVEQKIISTSTDPEGRAVRLTASTWDHIKERHPEVKRAGGIAKIASTITKPNIILQNERAAIIYVEQTLMDFYFHVITKPDESPEIRHVTTAYFDPKLLRGETIWQQSK